METPLERSHSSNTEPTSNLIQADLIDTRTQRSKIVHMATSDWFRRLEVYVHPLFVEENEENANIKVAILDTGIDTTHPLISQRENSLKYYDFTKENPNGSEKQAVDICGHGTHLAGIILRVAPHVELYIARVFESRTPSGNDTKAIAKAIKYATDEWEVDIISMSFGFHDNDPEITEALFAAYEKNTVLLAAVSNDGNRSRHSIAFPARLPYIFCINSADGDGNKSRFNPDAPNGRGKTWKSDNFSILGENISSCWPKSLVTNDQIDIEDDEGAFKVSSGSSVVTAVVAAVAALVMDFGTRNKEFITKYEKLKSFRGIQQIFTLMSDEDEIEGFKNIRPWFALNGLPWDAAHLFDNELKNP